MKLAELETPCLVLDRTKMLRNVEALHARLKRFGVGLRPHGKTGKNIDSLRPALAGQPGGITVSTLKEAEYYFGHGIRDIVYAVGIAPVKLDRVAGLIRQGAKLTVILDSVEQARAVAAKAREHGVSIPALIEIDSDGHRSGVEPGDPLLVEIGRTLHAETGTALAGVLTHAGASYDCTSVDAIRAVAQAERDGAVACAEALRRSGLPCPVVSVGSTPTAFFAEDLSGVTEVRAGVFLFFDLVMAGLGVCRPQDIAVSVLSSVIGHQKRRGWAITDAGWMALSRDRGTASQAVDQGYGLVCNLAGEPLPGLVVKATNQEHGIVAERSGKPVDWAALPIGGMVRILPNHACATAAMFDRYHVVEGSTDVVDVWQRINGW
jgi:D-serine deaminase-like pyridoxal phosphate-dependent protein